MQALALQKDLFISLLKIDILLHRDMKSFWGANYSWAAVGNVCVCVCACVSMCVLFFCFFQRWNQITSGIIPAVRLFLGESPLSLSACSRQDFTVLWWSIHTSLHPLSLLSWWRALSRQARHRFMHISLQWEKVGSVWIRAKSAVGGNCLGYVEKTLILPCLNKNGQMCKSVMILV